MLSVVIPVCNERESLVELRRELDAVAQRHGYVLDMIFVDDGSTDGTWDVIEQLAKHDRRLSGIRLRRNFGKASALSAGLASARGEFVITLDGDLQDDPGEIPRFLAKMDCGLDVVSGWKKKRHDPWHKVLLSNIFNWMVSRMTKVHLHDHNCGFKCYRRQIFDEIRLYGELHRFVPVMAAARGWRVGELEVNHRPRKYGRSKYGLARVPKGILDLLTVKFLTGFGQRPQHLLGVVGLVFLVAGGLGLGWLTLYWFVSRIVESIEPVHLHERAVFYYSIAALLLGAQFTSIGLLAELLTAINSSRQPSYSVSQRVGHLVSHQGMADQHSGAAVQHPAATPLADPIDPRAPREDA